MVALRTPLVPIAALILALAAPTAVALGLPASASADVRVGELSVSLATPSSLGATELAAIEGAVVDAPPLAPILSAQPPLAEIAAPFTPPDAPSTMGEAREPVPPAPAAVQAAAATGLLWLVLERLGLGRAMIGAGALLYSRLAPNELLDHERRERVVSLVRARPGIGPQEIGKALGMNWGVTSYHLDRLEGAGLLTSQRVGQHRCYFVPGAVPRDAQAKVGLFRGDTTRRVAELVREKPGIGQSELAAALGLSASATSKQLSRLEKEALVRREASGNGMRLFPQPALDSALTPAFS